MAFQITRRSLILGSGVLLAGCDGLSTSPETLKILGSAEGLTMASQRLIGRDALAQEYSRADISPIFKANGSKDPQEAAYLAHKASGFADWRLIVDGLVDRPLALSLADIKRLPNRSQITRHDCVEGWSAIGEWTGPQMGGLLKMAGAKPSARYVVLHCADRYGCSSDLYYESIDMVDANHPQTILAHSMNGSPLGIEYGAPLRLRVERQLGYKQAKYVMRMEVRDTLAGIGRGKGGYWPDRGYEWYAGI